MKIYEKLIIITVLVVVALMVVIPLVYAYDPGPWIPNPLKKGTLPEIIASIINILLVIAGVVAVIYLIIGGYQYITSAGNAETAAKGRLTVLNAIVGLIIIFASYLIVNFIMQNVF